MRTLIPILLLILASGSAMAQVTTAFTYQGELEQGGEPATGEYDFEFVIYDTPSSGAAFAGPVTVENLFVDGGLFHTELDFGPNIFGLMDLWLEIRVREGDSTGMFTTLSPRQKITPAPLALNAQNVEVGAVGTEQIATGAVVDDRIANDAITRRTLSADSVGSAEVEDESLIADDIGPGAVGASEIAGNAVGSSEIAPGAVGSNELAAGAVGSDQIAAGAVGADQIADESIPSQKLEHPYLSGSIDLETIAPSPLFSSTEIEQHIDFESPFTDTPVVTATLQSAQTSASRLLGPLRIDNMTSTGFDVAFRHRTIPVRAASKNDPTVAPLLEVNGRPAIVYRNVNVIYHVRATDAEGLRWGDPQILASGVIPSGLQFLIVDGHPAVILGTNDNRILYIRANDPDGNSWPAPTTLFDNEAGATITDVSAAIVSGVPALALLAEGEGLVYWAASDATGSNWPDISQATTITESDYGHMSLHEVDGRPAVSFVHDGLSGVEVNELRFVRALNVDGTDWPAPEIVVSGVQLQDDFGNTVLRIVDGHPAIFYLNLDYQASVSTTRITPHFVRASGSTGSSWNLPVDIAPFAQRTGLEIEPIVKGDGTIGLVWLDRDTRDLYYSRSLTNGSFFGAIPILNVPPNIESVGAAAAEIGGSFSASLSWPTHRELRFIRDSNPNPDTFINWMAIGN